MVSADLNIASSATIASAGTFSFEQVSSSLHPSAVKQLLKSTGSEKKTKGEKYKHVQLQIIPLNSYIIELQKI